MNLERRTRRSIYDYSFIGEGKPYYLFAKNSYFAGQ